MDTRRILFIVGLLLTLIGIGLIALGVDGLQAPIPCALNGCPSIFSSTYAAYWDEIYAGLATVSLGVALMLLSRRLKTEVQPQ